MKIALAQMNSKDDIEKNLSDAEKYIDIAGQKEGADLVVFPEYFAFLHDDPNKMQATGEELPGPIHARISAAAKRNGITVHAGSIVEKRGSNFYNTSVVFGPDGQELARYSKIHLFDIDSPNGVSYRESEMITRGSDVVTYQVGDLTVGCAICYDIRFPELFRKLRDLGAELIVLPAAFTLATGKDHWEVLLRARAIETQTYFVATGQALSYADGRKWNWGHSSVADPWGHIVAQASDRVGLVVVNIDPDYISQVRQSIPVANHHVLA